ncbi:hypothetical protein [Methanopyrus kandleri]|uniref:hypothetical protein n=1 Tax=Methanopyrus kandleri TaxID=2320 RepID=UPI00130508E9|nr:hypothetical protein [Methanopyrus kandleri]
MLEALVLAALSVPGDPGEVLERVVEHPEVLLAKGGAVEVAAVEGAGVAPVPSSPGPVRS